jgi:hypothetical protein
VRFQFCQGWQVQFLEADLKPPLTQEADLHRPGQIPELARAGRGLEEIREPADVGVFLRLTPDPYARLRLEF